MTLPDVYAVFNRARGTELISPTDLYTVATMLGPLSLGMSLHTFPSGVAVIQVRAAVCSTDFGFITDLHQFWLSSCSCMQLQARLADCLPAICFSYLCTPTSQADEHDEAAVSEKLVRLAAETPLVAGSCAAALRVSLVLAQVIL